MEVAVLIGFTDVPRNGLIGTFKEDIFGKVKSLLPYFKYHDRVFILGYSNRQIEMLYLKDKKDLDKLKSIDGLTVIATILENGNITRIQ